MRFLFRVFVNVSILLTFALGTFAQLYKYQVTSNNKVIGSVEAHQKGNGSLRHIIIKSRLQLKLIGNVNTDIEAEFKNNHLLSASSTRLTNKEEEKNKNKTTTQLVDKNYQIVHDGKKSELKQAIQFVVGDLYFTEPKDIKSVYSETQGQMLDIRALNDGQYELIMPDGKKNVYTYAKGKLIEVEVNHVLGKVYFKLIDS
ncbi:hypothetical protein LX64_00201 [Chitinophaga skermanii]|uniref:Uncharacterized protein n=1 Tax=Chitinophaga skermanii TaxID=331697 RepID=A0A327R138_9BACT|nr:DUF6134 family protein [Chitinophaga skermanii]RAJ10596.1 hypothetical protein LX64_00201 [Chitinophaga skermanii]